MRLTLPRLASGARRSRPAGILLVTTLAVTVAVAGSAAGATTRSGATSKAKPPVKVAPRTLGALDRWMDAAVRAQGSVSFSHSTVVTGTASSTLTGVARWARGATSAAYAVTSGPITIKLVMLPTEGYDRDLSAGAPGPWIRFHEGDRDPEATSWTPEFQLLRQQLDPALMYHGLSSLKLATGRPQLVDGVRCSTFTVRMTTVQKFATVPAQLRPAPAAQRGGITTTTFYVDARGLPHKVVEVNSWKGSGSYSEVTTFARWGGPVTVRAPSGEPVVDAASLVSGG